MSNGTKLIMGAVAVVVLGIGGWWYMNKSSNSVVSTIGQTETQANTGMTAQPGTQPSPYGGSVQSNTSATGGASAVSTNNSDAAMTQDASAIDGEMSGLTADNTSADQGMNSK